MENTATQNKNPLVRLIEKAYGGLDMSWRNVILFAVGTAVLTAFFMIVPIFKDTSFERMGSLFESWIFFAVIIMANCYQKEDTKNGSFFDKIRQPLICAAKVFVFFLISQPLIYLLEVPFKEMGWKLFGYYPYWFKWTLATIPMAFIGWYINKKNWLSLIILSPILFELTSDYIGAFRFTFKHFPIKLVTAVFCLAQVLVYLWVFTPKLVQRLLGFFVPLAVIIVMNVMLPPFDMNVNSFLPDDVMLTENAVVEIADPASVEITVTDFGEDTSIHIHATDYVETTFQITDGDNVYHYRIRIYEDDGGHSQIEMQPIGENITKDEKNADETSSME